MHVHIKPWPATMLNSFRKMNTMTFRFKLWPIFCHTLPKLQFCDARKWNETYILRYFYSVMILFSDLGRFVLHFFNGGITFSFIIASMSIRLSSNKKLTKFWNAFGRFKITSKQIQQINHPLKSKNIVLIKKHLIFHYCNYEIPFQIIVVRTAFLWTRQAW